MSTSDGSTAITIENINTSDVVYQWGDGGFAVGVLLMGRLHGISGQVVDGVQNLETTIDTVEMQAGTVATLVLRVACSQSAAPRLFEDAVGLPDERDLLAHRLALWGSEVPCLGSPDLPDATYPTVNAPTREYGTLHTFFDPDAWSAAVALAYSGIDILQRRARNIVERAIDNIRPDGLIPHHFDGSWPEYVAISGSPQPGPNLFVIEAATDIACATGDLAWLRQMWGKGIRSAAIWLLTQLDETRGLLNVVGALWVDVFRRSGFTLDTNAMAVRTFSRAAEVARVLADPLADRLEGAANSIRENIGALWAKDHFVTSRSPDWSQVDDHEDAENYLAIATGAASPEQGSRIVDHFDSALRMHPEGRGTLVSLRRYESEDCYLGNVGDSDIAMARLWWADLLARRAMGDTESFRQLFTPVRDDLVDNVWMRERYSSTGVPVRADGYHEYPDLIDFLLREGVYGLSIDMASVRIRPMRPGPFDVHWGKIRLVHSEQRVYLSLADELERSVVVYGLKANACYRSEHGVTYADQHGMLQTTIRGNLDLQLDT
ncbi:hypothetical protein BJ994_003530 [Arthrobacter pigmenti]|uniref:Uncharacterized protein n=1 Tax=Arthrobacter pigmenti TaxID=271432 RepID=A0A846RV51_9MICC|nr:hypothetical protein [Arthrobacter pigmenti]NJC24454.1 hypothetical protein [Arthrobacter pigmenti]